MQKYESNKNENGHGSSYNMYAQSMKADEKNDKTMTKQIQDNGYTTRSSHVVFRVFCWVYRCLNKFAVSFQTFPVSDVPFFPGRSSAAARAARAVAPRAAGARRRRRTSRSWQSFSESRDARDAWAGSQKMSRLLSDFPSDSVWFFSDSLLLNWCVVFFFLASAWNLKREAFICI